MRKDDYKDILDEKKRYEEYVVEDGRESSVYLYYDRYMDYLFARCKNEIAEISGLTPSYSSLRHPSQPSDLDFWIPEPYYEDVYERTLESSGYEEYAKLVACKAFLEDYSNSWGIQLRKLCVRSKIYSLLERYNSVFDEHDIDPSTNGLSVDDKIC